MAPIDTFFKQRDKRRWAIDRLIRSLIKVGGVSVLITLVLLIVYLIWVTIPIFSSADLKPVLTVKTETYEHNTAKAIGISDDGQHAFIFRNDGEFQFYPLNGSGEKHFSQQSIPQQSISQQQIMSDVTAFRDSNAESGWYGYANDKGEVMAVKPSFSTTYTQNGNQVVAKLTRFREMPILLSDNQQPIESFDFSIAKQQAIFIGRDDQDHWQGIGFGFDKKSALMKGNNKDSLWESYRISIPLLDVEINDYRLTPNGQTLYVLSPTTLFVLKRKHNQFILRESVELTSSSRTPAVGLSFLSGAKSLLIRYQGGQVSQWFDVLKNEQRHLTHIRDFQLGSTPSLLLPDYFRKGFYSFQSNGMIKNFYTTTNKEVLSKSLLSAAPQAAATSRNERYLVTVSKSHIRTFEVSNYHPEIAISSLWSKIWYEGYEKPEYVWQSTSASNDFEAKFSLAPIAFGTLKAALFAMLFAVPIALCGAIYTAYFMTPKMRKYVKPTIELMEALPTVIIGFLAGLWFAPWVEMNLFSLLLLFIILPVVIISTAVVWNVVSLTQKKSLRNEWLALLLIPILLIASYIGIQYGHHLEHIMFKGDIRLFLASYGVDFDQRNALIVGFAMGFAVIPTIFTIAEDAIFSVPKHLSDGASALGATPWQCLTTVVLATASPGIFSAVMMGLGRAVGETMIVLMATGNTPVMDWNILEGMRTLSANIAIEMPESQVGGSHFRLLFLSAFLLFVFTFIVNSIAEVVRQRLREKYRAM
ncbi:ABC transporter permease subunit [Vibrio sp. S17_S38]|uniref:ABC transporter permease subunit n=1 Tax=Vibrio sp. S17_S38 TaxID=2720229 RepID=UPI0016814C29|nr:ABC transporter permease subunit [Vibrio sp. S17_S38]MBD1573585.1 ABC transporter permease subunit [Vibrio sp. S17_S38]